ncbi:MAG TPA: hypothetical protein VND65_20225 [Candidatus Binatia bacterium]|nr:hypothetical protein [Candidatus Binatia bacterium]
MYFRPNRAGGGVGRCRAHPKNTGPQNGMLYIDDNGGGGRQGISLSGTGD